MADNGVNKKPSQSKASSNPKISAPSSMGGTSAPGIVFDYCPTEFAGQDAQPEMEKPASGAFAETAPAEPAGQAVGPEPAAGQAVGPAPAAEPETPPPAAAADEAKLEQPASKAAEGEPGPDSQTSAEAPQQATGGFASQTMSPPFPSRLEFTSATAAELSLRMLDMAQANFNASFEFARQAANAKDLSQLIELQTTYLQQQFAAVTAQTEEMAEFARKFSSLSVLKDFQARRFENR
jgi:phasin family protein